MLCNVYYQRSLQVDGFQKFHEYKGLTRENLQTTHALIRQEDFPVSPEDNREVALEEVFHRMQGGNWNRKGRYNGWLEENGVGHSSMCVGDLVEIVETKEVFQVLGIGFRKVRA